MMACYFVTGMMIFILALGLEATSLQVQNAYENVRDDQFLPRHEEHPSLDIQLLKKIVAILEADAHENAYIQRDNTQHYQQMIANAYKEYMQGPGRYGEEMVNENRGIQQKAAAEKFYDVLQAVVASKTPGSEGHGSFAGTARGR